MTPDIRTPRRGEGIQEAAEEIRKRAQHHPRFDWIRSYLDRLIDIERDACRVDDPLSRRDRRVVESATGRLWYLLGRISGSPSVLSYDMREVVSGVVLLETFLDMDDTADEE